ncbi:MAG: T9SS type B sorting domain-containing protein, partial [Saprospiraceae bacterium]|nr:T9SS type B sorting domain-containing protein [Saprospiraceae bacterium]
QILISGYHENDDKGFIAELLLPLDEADNSCILSDELYTVNTIDRPHISTPVSLSEANPALTTIITPKNFSNVSIQTEGACTYSCLEICGNGMDDNLDGLIDCEDPIFRDSCCCLPVPWLDLGQDTLVCENAAVELLADPGFVSYKWNTGETERIITAAFDGLYQVEAVDSCGNQVIDSIRVGYFENTILELGQDTFTCENSVEISSNLQFTNYQWYVNNSNYGCPGCPSLIVNEQAGDYEIICVASNQNGCISVDTIQLRINEKIEYDINLGEDIVSCDDLIQLNAGYNNIQWSDGTSGSDLNVTASGIYIAQLIDTICAVTYADTIIIELLDDISMDTIFNICSGESVMFYGEEYDVAGDYTQAVPGLMMCDTMYFIEVQLDASNRVDESYYICQGDSIYINQEWIYEERYLEFRKSNTEGCDSLFFISIEMLNHSYSSLAYKLCEGESVEVNQLVYDNEGVYTQNFNNDVGCDSLLEIDITFNSPTESYVETVICEGARYSFNGIRYDEAGSYEQILLNHAGCDSLVYITIDVEDIYIPNIFSPTLPGNNEFKAYTNCQFDSYALSVYDRWGNLVFHSSDPDEAWNGIKDGKLLEQGVYMYAIEYSTQNVSKQNSIFGSITLIL